MIYSDFNYLLLLLMVSISTIAARVSIQRRKYSGWYETFNDVSKLAALLQNAVLCFVSVLFSLLLLAVSPETRPRDAATLGVILFLYLLVVVFFFCYPQLHRFVLHGRARLSYGLKVLRSKLFKGYSRPVPPEKEDPATDGPADNDEEPTARDIFLRFLSFFSLTLAVCTVLFLALLLLTHNTADAPFPPGLLELIRNRGQWVIQNYHMDLLLPFFLLSLTSCTGSLLAAVGLDYQRKYPFADRAAQHKLDELTNRIRSR